MEKPVIYEYDNYRKFLKDIYAFLKKKQRGFSFRSFAMQADLGSPNYLKLVMDGKRNLSSAEMISKFCRGLKLNQQEGIFFEALVGFNQAKSVDDKNRFFKRMQGCQRYRKIKEIEHDQFEFMSKWYYVALLELTHHPDFQEDGKWIAHALDSTVTPEQAMKALELLQKIGLLKHTEEGKLIQVERNMATPPEVNHLASVNFHREMLKKASESLEKTHGDLRDLSAVTFSLREDQIPALKSEILKFRRGLMANLGHIKNPERVYQMSVSLFPLTRKTTVK